MVIKEKYIAVKLIAQVLSKPLISGESFWRFCSSRLRPITNTLNYFVNARS